MTINPSSKVISSVRLFRTSPHPCSYKENHRASTVFVDPELVIDKSLNSKLSDLGYRRSGAHLYRPDCDFAVPVSPAEFQSINLNLIEYNEKYVIIIKTCKLLRETTSPVRNLIHSMNAISTLVMPMAICIQQRQSSLKPL